MRAIRIQNNDLSRPIEPMGDISKLGLVAGTQSMDRFPGQLSLNKPILKISQEPYKLKQMFSSDTLDEPNNRLANKTRYLGLWPVSSAFVYSRAAIISCRGAAFQTLEGARALVITPV